MFIRGINYWPIKKAMYWWKEFNIKEVAADFQLLSSYFNVIRIFLLWEDFQPRIDQISRMQLTNLRAVTDLADRNGLLIMPTFFCGHMSGVNWMPPWMLQDSEETCRFPIYSNGRIVPAAIRNFYTDSEIMEAQLYQISEVCTTLAGHPAVYAYDLGNEPSNCVQPPNRKTAQEWLNKMCAVVHTRSQGKPVTLGMHAEDLEENRQLWPQDAALYCDFLSMHGYPFYLSWVEDPLDVDLVPFLGLITQYLGQKEVLFQEFGLPTRPVIPPRSMYESEPENSCTIFSEADAHDYYLRVLNTLRKVGMMGGMAWCYGDYSPERWDKEPLQQNLHERHFGLYRHDGSTKPALDVFASNNKNNSTADVSHQESFLQYLEGFNRDLFYDQPIESLSKLFQVYKKLSKGIEK